MNILKKIIQKFKPKPKPLTLEETLEKISSSYHFNSFDENLISEIYSLLLQYGMVKVFKIHDASYVLEVTVDNRTNTCRVTTDGFTYTI